MGWRCHDGPNAVVIAASQSAGPREDIAMSTRTFHTGVPLVTTRTYLDFPLAAWYLSLASTIGAKQEKAVTRMILVADDSPTIQKRAVAILKAEGFEVETVSNGVAAIKRLATLHPAVILADVSMPGRDGYEVCEFVRKSPEFCNLPVLLVVSDMEPYDHARGAEVGADGIVKKPFDPYALIAIVAKFAERFEATQGIADMSVGPPAPPPESAEAEILIPELEETPLVTPPVAPEFSVVPQEPLSSEPAVELATGNSIESLLTEAETAYSAPLSDEQVGLEPGAAPEFGQAPPPEPQGVPEAGMEVVTEEATDGPFSAAHLYSPTDGIPSFPENSEAVAPEAPSVNAATSPTPEPLASTFETPTAILDVPLDSVESTWDETVFAPASPEPAVPSLTSQSADASVLPPDIAVEQTEECDHIPATTARLDSFILDQAAAGEPHFASEVQQPAALEVAHSEPAPESIEAPAEETTGPEAVLGADAWEAVPARQPAPEAAGTEVAIAEQPAPEVGCIEATTEQPAAETAEVEIALAETIPEVTCFEAVAAGQPAPQAAVVEAPPEAASEAVLENITSPEPAPGDSLREATPNEQPEPEVGSAENAPPEFTPESAPVTVPPPEPAMEGPSMEAARIEQLAEEARAGEIAFTESGSEAAAVELVAARQPLSEAASPDSSADTAAPSLAFDSAFIYSIVHKVVVKMAPPPLPPEAVEEVAKRIAAEITAEICSESPRV